MLFRYFISSIVFLKYCLLTYGQMTGDMPHTSDSINSATLYPDFFKKDSIWKGADGASTVDLGNGRILWLFSDTFVSLDSPHRRTNSKIIRNSIAIQQEYCIDAAVIKYFYGHTGNGIDAFFRKKSKSWFWIGHGILVRGKLLIFLIEEVGTGSGLGFKAVGWRYVIIDNPGDSPANWKIKYKKGASTFDVIAGSAAVISDSLFTYFFGVEEPGNHDVYLLRIPVKEVLSGKIKHVYWWSNDKWIVRKNEKDKRPSILFKGATEFSVHYNADLKKYIQVRTEGFGNAYIIMRLSEKLEGPWSKPVILCQPDDSVRQKIVYTANSHPELKNGLLITYNVNSLDSDELANNENIYYPRFIKIDLSCIRPKD